MKRAASKSATAIAISVSMLTLSACASIFAGTSRNITVNTEPPAARCNLTRMGASVGVASETPQTVNVSKSKHDIDVSCQKPGYSGGLATIESEFEPWTLGNILLGGLVGVIVDMSTGAVTDYPASTTVRLTPQPGMAPHASTAPQAPRTQGPGPRAQQQPQQQYVATQSDYSLYQPGYGNQLSYSDRVAQYGQDLKRINDDADQAIEDTRASCMWGNSLEWIGDQDQSGCEARVAQIEAQRQQAINQLDQKWRGTYMQ